MKKLNKLKKQREFFIDKRQRIYEIADEIIWDLNNKRMSYEAAKRLYFSKQDRKNLPEWYDYYSNKIKECEEEINSLEQPKTRSYIVLSIFLITSLIFLSYNYFNFTGFTIYEDQPATIGNDTYIQEGLTANFGAATTLKTGMTAANKGLRPLIQFNVTDIPSSSSITNAVVTLYLEVSSDSLNMTVRTHRITTLWNESTATWDNATSAVLWATAGGDYSSRVENLTNITSSLTYYNITITNLVKEWINGTYQNYGIIVVPDSNTPNGTIKEFSSSDSTTAAQRPRLIIDYTDNAPPTIDSLIDSSNRTNVTLIGNAVTFTVNWSDIDDTQTKLFVCNSTVINSSGCLPFKQYCSASFSSTSPISCSYAALNSDNTSAFYSAGICDDGNNCTNSSLNNFYVNHLPNITIIQPNGGETVNQSQGNYLIKFNVSDFDEDFDLTAAIYYSTSPSANQNIINGSVNLTYNCQDSDTKKGTANNCSIEWNTTNLYADYYIDVVVNDSWQTSNDSSDSTFSVVSAPESEAPNITSESITSNLTSGEVGTVRANITDPHIRSIWFTLNNTNTNALSNITMAVESGHIYSGNFTTGIVGNYSFRVYADDTLGNINNTRSWILFNVTIPNATVINLQYPPTATLGTTIIIKATLNNSDIINSANVSLETNGDFTYLTNYPKNRTIGNISANIGTNITWVIGTPFSPSNYTLNITFLDGFSNKFQSNNFFIFVATTTTNETLIDINSNSEVATGSVYSAQALVYDGLGNLVDAEDVKFRLYDSLGNLVVGPVSYTGQPATGIYNYSYTTPSTPEGNWLTVVNVTRNSIQYSDQQYWKLTGGPFDVRSITITDSTIPTLNISVTTENTGGATQDLVLTWNLTRVDTGALLDSGQETFAVNANSIRIYSVSPSTTYAGNVKVTFIGSYGPGFTEQAGAFETFTTTEETSTTTVPSVSPQPGPTGQGQGGGSGGREVKRVPQLEFLTYEKEVLITPKIKKPIEVQVINTGNVELLGLYLKLEGLSSDWYKVVPSFVESLKPNLVQSFEIIFELPDMPGLLEQNFLYNLFSSKVKVKEIGKLLIKSPIDYYLNEVSLLKSEIEDIKKIIKEAQLSNIDIEDIPARTISIEKNIKELETLINKEDFINAEFKLINIRSLIKDVKSQLSSLMKEEEPKSKVYITTFFIKYWKWILTWLLIISLLVTGFLLYKKLSIFHFTRRLEKKYNYVKEIQKDNFDSKLEEIRRRL